MKVNMTPNPLDVVTIHASQGDTEARQWEFELHNNGELIDTSDVKEQMVFKSYKGGTEQILPENGSTPTTSPFLGDIKYPQGLLSDQEFLYRESPTEEDGLAKITDIKGNTLVWNQLVQNGNFADGTNRWTVSNPSDSISVSDNTLSFHTDVVYGAVSTALPIDVNNHVLLVKAQVRTQGKSGIVMAKMTNNFGYTNSNFAFRIEQVNVWTDVLMYGRYTTTPEGSTESPRIGFQDYRNIGSSNLIEVKNVQVFDLTQMGLDSITEPSEFTSLFSLPYYVYNTGTLLSFNGTGIKTMGANNMFGIAIRNNTNWIYQEVSNRAIFEFDVEPETQYSISIDYSSNVYQAVVIYKEAYNNSQISNRALGAGVKEFTITTPSNCRVLCLQFESNASVTFTANDFPNRSLWYCLKDPSEISTTSLPISTYFPTGMKSARNAYDELTPVKATTKIREITIDSSSNIVKESTGWNPNIEAFYITLSPTAAWYGGGTVINNTKSDKLETVSYYSLRTTTEPLKMALTANGRELEFTANYSSVDDLKTWLVSNPIKIVYELATPTETSFTTASLVTENAEIPLSNNDGVLIGKCTEQLSENPGFIDAKIKLSDSDGECYSNKIQLHVERSPQ